LTQKSPKNKTILQNGSKSIQYIGRYKEMDDKIIKLEKELEKEKHEKELEKEKHHGEQDNEKYKNEILKMK
jgi:hypothetical protein